MLFEKISQCIEEASNYISTIWILNAIIFYMPSSMSNIGLCMWISTCLLVQNKIFLKVPCLMDMRILWTCTLLTYKQEFEIPQSLSTWKNGVFGPQNTHLEEKATILQMVKNEYIKFDRHVDPNFAQSTFLSIGAILKAILIQKTTYKTLGIMVSKLIFT